MRTLRALGVSVTLCWLSSARAGDGAELLHRLRENEAKMFQASGAVGVSFRMTIWAHPFDPQHGKNLAQCAMTVTPESCAMKVISKYERPPVYRAMGTLDYSPVDYDRDGNLIVWRPIEKYILWTKDRNEALEVLDKFRLNPQGRILARDRYTQLYRFPIGSLMNVKEFYQFFMATGRGFAQDLETVTGIEPLESGLRRLTANGGFGPGLRGEWTLIVDPASSYLVREATFVSEGNRDPSVIVTSSGSVTSGGLTIGKHGVVKGGTSPQDYEVSFDVIRFLQSPITDSLADEVKARVEAPLPPGGSETIDFRGEKPLRIPTPKGSATE